MEIVQQKENFCIIKSLEEISQKEFDTALRRIFLLLKDASDDIIEGAKKMNIPLLETIEEKHDSIAKFISFCLRVLNKKGYTEPRKTTLLYHIIASLDKLTDILKYSARDLIKYKHKLKKETIELLEGINQSISWYCDLFYKFELKEMSKLYENRDKTLKMIRKYKEILSHDELLLLQYFEHILEFLVDITEARLGLEY